MNGFWRILIRFEDSIPSELNKNKTYTVEEQDVLKNKNNILRTKYFMDMTKKRKLAGKSSNEFQQRSYA